MWDKRKSKTFIKELLHYIKYCNNIGVKIDLEKTQWFLELSYYERKAKDEYIQKSSLIVLDELQYLYMNKYIDLSLYKNNRYDYILFIFPNPTLCDQTLPYVFKLGQCSAEDFILDKVVKVKEVKQ